MAESVASVREARNARNVRPANAALTPIRFSHQPYFRIYLALLLSLLPAAALFAAAWRLNPDAAQVGPSLETFAEFAAEILPPATADDATQQAALAHWQPRVRSDLALYAADGRRIAAAGRRLPPLDPQQTGSG